MYRLLICSDLCISNVLLMHQIVLRIVKRHIEEATDAGISCFDVFRTNAGGGIPYTLLSSKGLV